MGPAGCSRAPPAHHSRAAWLIPSKRTRRMLELPKQHRGLRAMRDMAIDQNSHAEELPFDLSERTRLMQIAPFVSTRFHGCNLGVRFSNAYFEICKPKTVRPWPDSSKST